MMEKKIIALSGNPNSGKTTIFNALTGSRQKVGNWPGVTVERKEGTLKIGEETVTVVDLPGCYGLTASSLDEKIARDFLIEERPFLVAVVLDSSNLERNLYLPLQLMELGLSKLILIFNMMDEAKARGIEIDTQTISRVLGVPVVRTVANRGIGIKELKRTISSELKSEGPPKPPFRYSEDLEAAISELEDMLNGWNSLQGIPTRWLSIKLLEGDEEYTEKVDSAVLSKVERLKKSLESKLGYDLATAFVEQRYGYIKGIIGEAVKKKRDIWEEITLSDRIDRFITNRFLGIPIFLFIIWMTFKFTFSLGGVLADYIDSIFGILGDKTSWLIQILHGPTWLSSLVKDGIIGGVGAVLTFFPNIFCLFLAISFLEEVGYMARGAFVMDRIMHAMGLHGKSFIPMILGFGCNIPGIMAARTLENEKDRIITILVNPLISCSARLPIYVLFAGALFPKNKDTVILSMYILGVILAILMARLFKSTFFKGEPAPLIMELPPYRIPTWKGVFIAAWHRSSLFVKKAGTIILAAVILVWFLASMPPGVEYASGSSLVGKLGSFLAPLFKPAGFGSWQAAVALLFGIMAKESVVGTLGTLYHAEDKALSSVIASKFTPLGAYAFMVMSLVYIPCIATIAAIKKETGSWRWTAFAVFYSLALGWGLATAIYQVGRLLF